MINIKSYAKTKQNIGQGYGSGGSVGSGSSQVIVNNSSVNDWFYFNENENSVHCRYTLGSDYDVFAFGLGDASYGPGGGGCNCSVIDNLLSDSSTASLSANQGRILKDLIDNIDITGGGDGHVHTNKQILDGLNDSSISNLILFLLDHFINSNSPFLFM